jgi:hypothetical protein
MHRNAPLTAEGRFRLCQRIEAGWTIAAAAESMNISRQTAHKWWGGFGPAEGCVGRSPDADRPEREWRVSPFGRPRRLDRLFETSSRRRARSRALWASAGMGEQGRAGSARSPRSSSTPPSR